MPYDLQQSGDGYYVVDANGKRHSDKPMPKADAMAQMRALYANEKKEFIEHSGAMVALPIPEAYQLVSELSFPATAEVLPQWEMHVTLSFLGDVEKLDVKPEKLFSIIKTLAANTPPVIGKINGYGVFTETHMEGKECLWLSFDAPALPELHQNLLKALSQNGINVEMNHGFTPHITVAYFPKGEMIDMPGFEPKQVMIRFLRVAWADMTKEFPFNGVMKEAKNGFHVFKQADGAYRWVTISSSAFKDRDGEIVTRKALLEDVDRCDERKDYGPLRWFHLGGWEAPDGLERWDTWKATGGVDIGNCDFNMVHGKMLIESGTFKTAEMGEAFAQVANLEVSIAFSHPKDEPGKNKAYNNIHRFERSLLPEGWASNLLTKTYVIKGDNMDAKEKLKLLGAILRGKPELAQQILADAENVQKAAEESGLEFKEVEEMISGSIPDTLGMPEGAPVAEPPAEEVIETPTAPVVETPTPEAAAVPEPDGLARMTLADLTAFVQEVVNQTTAKQAEPIQAKQAGLETQLADALVALKAANDKLATIEHTMEEQKKSLDALTDARPVGVKLLQSMRPTERAENVTTKTVTGPQMDPGFQKFVLGGK